MRNLFFTITIIVILTNLSCSNEGQCICRLGTKDTTFYMGKAVSTADGNKKCATLKTQYNEDSCYYYIPKKM